MARKFYIENNEAIPSIVFEEIQPNGFVEIVDSDELKKLYKKKYNERTKDGEECYNNIRTELYLDIVNGTVTDIQAFEFEQHIKSLADNLLTGNWLTAKYTNENLTLLGIYNSEMKLNLQNIINDYVDNNY